MGNIGAISSSYTFQVAVKPVAAPSPYTILSYTSGSGTGSVTFRLDYSSSIQTAVFSAFASSGSVNKTYNLSTTIPTGSWSILHGRFNGFALALFKNGSFTNSTLITGSNVGYSANNRFLVGGVSLVTGSYLSGSVANVAVYNTSLSTYFIATNYNGLATRFGLTNIITPSTDPDAQAFIEATGITDPIEISAITTLVTDLKTYNIWDKMKAMYPMVGGTATSQKYNLKNPNTFIGTFVGGWTHSSTGALPNGVNAYMDTSLNGTNLINNNHHQSFYSRTNVDSGGFQIGAGVGFGILTGFRIRNSGNINAFNQMSSFSPFLEVTNPTSQGLCLWSRTSSTLARAYMNLNTLGTLINTATGDIANLNTNFYLASLNGTQNSSNECAFASIGDGLTDTEASNFYTAVQTFQTTLGRQV